MRDAGYLASKVVVTLVDRSACAATGFSCGLDGSATSIDQRLARGWLVLRQGDARRLDASPEPFSDEPGARTCLQRLRF